MKLDTKRILIAGTGSGSGKTTITAGILKCLANRGIRTASFKCGPDYIDPMFHSRITGRPGRTLDPYFCDKDTLRFLMSSGAGNCDMAVAEGVMGYYDGIGFTTEASTYYVAAATKTPVILVIDCKGMGASVGAVLQGFLEYTSGDSMIRGVIYNQLPAKLAQQAMKTAERAGIRPVGYLPADRRVRLESRHLGLVTAEEVRDFDAVISRIASAMEGTIDINAIAGIAAEAETLVFPSPSISVERKDRIQVRIAVARDRAFSFHYTENSEMLENEGCEIVPFSPLSDVRIPENVDGMILSGGYPELYAEPLSQNESMKTSVFRAVTVGMPTIAECGGFMYLQDTLEGVDGVPYPMVGLLSGYCADSGALRRFGYVEVTAQNNGLLCKKGDSFRAHEFHHWDSTARGEDFTAVKPDKSRQWNGGFHTETLYAGFPHIFLPGCPEICRRFVMQCELFRRRRLVCDSNV